MLWNKKIIIAGIFLLFLFFPFQQVDAYCGDGIKEAIEQCDNGQSTPGYNIAVPFEMYDGTPSSCTLRKSPGCNLDCTIEQGFYCSRSGSQYYCNNVGPADYILQECKSVCGDGVKSSDEGCDSGGHCFRSTAPNYGNACTKSATSNWGACTTQCSDCTLDCPSVVVNSDVNSGECVGYNIGCATFSPTIDGCNAVCQPDQGWTCSGSPSVCISPCGNGVRETIYNEECDNTDIAGQTCASILGPTYNGSPTCNNTVTPFDCTLNTSSCYRCGDGNPNTPTGSPPGNEQCDSNPSNCSVSYANPPGSCQYCTTSCAWATKAGTYCGDGLITTPQEECDGSSLGGITCQSRGFSGGTPTCYPSTDTVNRCKINTTTCSQCGNNLLDAGETCDGTALNSKTCQTQGFDGGTLTCMNATVPGNCGAFNTTACYRCGDGNINPPGESCDGLNLGTATCSTVPGGFNRGTLSCSGCGFNTSQCYTCGNGIITPVLEQCDQGGGNIANGDGCDSNCQTQTGYGCTGTPSVCALTCGNGTWNTPGEMCDPNYVSAPPNQNGAGSASCFTPTTNYTGFKSCMANCSGYNACIPNQSCGDGSRNGNEVCDSSTVPCTSNSYNGTQSCVMTGPTPCQTYTACNVTERCGDGLINGPETSPTGCDNDTSAVGSQPIGGGIDGCSSTCQIEPGWSCQAVVVAGGQRSQCTLTCGNGNLDSSAGESCDPNHPGTATASCIANGYPGTQTCLNTCAGYGVCSTTLSCNDTILTNPPEACEAGNTEFCLVPVTGYSGIKTCQNCSYASSSCVSTEYCGDHIMNGNEECDWDPIAGANVGPLRGNDGCSTTCKSEPGYTCFGTNPTTCVFSCGDGEVQPTAPYNEDCDYGIPPTSADPVAGRNLFNGDTCIPTGYNSPCDSCTKSCKRETVRGEYCGDGIVNGPETSSGRCDDGNFTPGDGCTSCTVDFGYVCTGIYSVCTTRCGDGQCALGKESCSNCSNDCGMCPIGQRPGVAAAHEKGIFSSLFDKIKIFIVQPQMLIRIPGVDLGQTKIKEEFIMPPAPITSDYTIGEPTTVKIGEDYYTITIQTVDPSGTINFTIQ